ncbi:hypothetical protein Ddc_13850 [Ditylenchus destructor]|nr:hypothetical protein Ddc_13850 [Ditylenchus destructor]
MAFKRVKYQFECEYCDHEVEKYVSVTEQAMKKHYLNVHHVEISCDIDGSTNINDLPDVNLIKPFFERCGRHLRHFTFCHNSYLMEPAHTALTFLRMAPNVQHLRLWEIKTNYDTLKVLAEIMPHLKSLYLTVSLPIDENETNYSQGLIEWLQVMMCLEYLHLSSRTMLFVLRPFIQFPPTLKYLHLDDISNTGRILSWVAKECKDLKGLRITCHLNARYLNDDAYQAISQMKSLEYLSVSEPLPMSERTPSNFGYIFEALTELRVLVINHVRETVITAIGQYCNKLEHLDIDVWDSTESCASVLRLTSLPNLCSLRLSASNYPKAQTVEFLNRLIVMGNLKAIIIKMFPF